MKTFELSSKKNKNGRRHFKLILYEIFPDSCIDEANEVGTQFNDNGITWIRRYCEKALPSIKGMSLRCEFIDEARTEIFGHGDTGISDGLPIFENADVIGHFTKGYIEDVEVEDGSTKTFCIGEGEIDSLCYNNFVARLEKDIADGNAPNGSVEILKTAGNDGIIYKYGYKDKGRIPTVFEHSGYALLGIRPADKSAKILELNNKEDLSKMSENEIKSIVVQTVTEVLKSTSELSQCKEEYEKKLAEANEALTAATDEKNEVAADSEKIQKALDDCKKELDEAYKKVDTLHLEMDGLHSELKTAKTKERLGKLDTELSKFSEDEKEYAKEEIAAFNENPVESEIEAVISKIWEGIGKNSKKESKVADEKNSANDIEDIFGEVGSASKINDYSSIF